jgi:DNA replication protein DnaC
MKQHSTNLRQAFAANPSRFVATGANHSVTVSQSAGEPRLFQRVLAARRSADNPTHPLARKLHHLGLFGMAQSVLQISLDGEEISFERHLSFLIENEIADRNKRQLARRLRYAHLRYPASIAEVDYNALRGFDDALFHLLAAGQWIADKENAIIEGPTGVGKTWLACALGEKACRDGRSVRYESTPGLMVDLVALRGSKRHSQRMRKLASVDLLILDDWGLERFNADQRSEIFEILERRYDQGSTLITTPHAVAKWPRIIGGSTNGLLIDRATHNAHHLQLKGASLRARARNS